MVYHRRKPIVQKRNVLRPVLRSAFLNETSGSSTQYKIDFTVQKKSQYVGIV